MAKLKATVILGIQNLNPTGREILLSILTKGKHLDVKDKDIKILFGEPGSAQKIPPFLLRETKKGIQILFQNKPVTTYDRPHEGTAALHERVFNEIRARFEDMGIDTSEVSKLSLTHKWGAGAGARS